MFKIGFILFWVLVGGSSWAEDTPTAAEIVAKIDANMTGTSRTSTSTMTVVNARGRERSFQMRSYGRGEEDSAVVYLSPARDKGTKMLKKGDELWVYLPAIERTQKISGHMLRQGMMGSDFSYEDMMESKELLDAYTSTVTGTEEVEGRSCWVLEMVAKTEGVTYPKRMAWIDKEQFIMLKQELFALSGMKLKTWYMRDIQQFDGSRYFPKTMVIEDHLRKGSKTTLTIDELEFDVPLADEIFSSRWLNRR